VTQETISPSWYFLTNLPYLGFLPGFISITSVVMTPTLIPFFVLIALDARLRPPPPLDSTRRSRLLAHFAWLAMSPITFFCSALPALDAQVRLMIGKRMEYRVTEKV
jgi:hypothetical protein